MPTPTLPHRILSVSDLVALIRGRLEAEFPDVWVEGQVSSMRGSASGHLYFILKDRASQVKAVLFRAAALRLKFPLKEGLQVIARGRPTLYEVRGDFQLVLEYLEPKGVGALQLAFEELKERLAREGLFDPARKRPLPLLPGRVGLVTSLHGAAVRDMVTVLRRRCPILGIVIRPVPVQGEGAASLIAEGIRQLSRSKSVDVIIVGRGGGSIEDLWCFNEEAVVRAIAESPVPVVSAVGHETDVTLSDFAADLRAPTPSAAAEAVAPVLEDLENGLRNLMQRQWRALGARLTVLRHEVTGSFGALRAVGAEWQRIGQRVDDLAEGLTASVMRMFRDQRAAVIAVRHRVEVCSPHARIRRLLVLLPQLVKRVNHGTLAGMASRGQRLRAVTGALDSLSPLAILARGYSLVQRAADGRIVKTSEDVREGDEVWARLHRGGLFCTVRKIVPPA